MFKLLYFVAVGFVGYQHLLWGWLLLLPPSLFVLLMLVSTAIGKPDHVPELSDEANRLFRTNYPHYRFRHASVIFAHTAILCWMTSFVLAAFGCFRGFWWGIPIAIATVFVMGTVANIFNPNYRLTTPGEKLAHQELIDFLDASKITARKKTVDEIVARALQEKPGDQND